LAKLSEHRRLTYSSSSHAASISHLAASPYAARQRSPRKHLIGIGGVALLHLLLLWAISSGLARQVVRLTENTVEAVLMTEAPPPPPPPKPTPPPKTPPQKSPAPPPPAPTSTAPAITQAPTPPAATDTTSPPLLALKPTSGQRSCTLPQSTSHCQKPTYPPASHRMEEEGTTILKFLIGTDGRVLQSQIEKSSGHSRLDEASINALSKCQLQPGTIDGKPEQCWAQVQYTWRLE